MPSQRPPAPERPPLFSLDDAAFLALSFEGFEVRRRELIAEPAPDGQRPQLLSLRRI